MNRVGKPVYVAGKKAAVVVPVAIQLARDLLKQEKIMLPGNIHLYDLLSQSGLVETGSAGRCVHTIKVLGKHGPVELRALIFATDTIVPMPSRSLPTRAPMRTRAVFSFVSCRACQIVPAAPR